MTEYQSNMLKNTFSPLVLPQALQPGGLELYQLTGYPTPPPTPPTPQPLLQPLRRLGPPIKDNAYENHPIEAAASFASDAAPQPADEEQISNLRRALVSALAPEAVSFEADLVAAPPSAYADQLTIYRAKTTLELPDVSLDVPSAHAPDASSATAAVATKETMLPLPYLSPEERGPETHLAQDGLTYQPLILLAGEEGVEDYHDLDGDLLDGPGDMYHWV
ncbi:hypothetical protein DFH11DRAFT_1571737 [Phellopilus nigrolimitatus]|nr:hypothetical protein DFH11DRAFT_1571737 [Phellopilus nigrolimitatus]